MQKKYETGLMWFRRDLRVQDNAALYHALKSCKQVFCAFVFDRSILDSPPRIDRRVEFIRESVLSLDGQLQKLGAAAGSPGASLLTAHHGAVEAIVRLAAELQADAVFTNHDDEPQSLALHSPWLATPLELAAAGVELGKNYPLPIVQHDEAQALTLQRYAVVKKA
jgi:deoxyribodipyrimidine photo-lyase